jgi:hypothetical protein
LRGEKRERYSFFIVARTIGFILLGGIRFRIGDETYSGTAAKADATGRIFFVKIARGELLR